MIIKQFTLLNFGRHEQIEFNSDAHVVGLLGPNGVGKSTVLDAIEFAITGETRDPMATYVRHGEGNASIAMTFIKNGMEGRIFRQFGKTPKRTLDWDGRTIKAAKEVDATMTKIFGADKQAIANAVFINQGTLDKILFSGDAERRALFIRLVNMSYCEQISHMLEGKIKKLQLTIVDLGPALDLAAAHIQQTDAARKQAEQVYAALPDHTADLAYCDNFLRNEDQLRQVMAQLASVENDYNINLTRFNHLLGVWKVQAYADASTQMDSFDNSIAQLDKTFTEWRSIKMELTHYNRVSTELTDKSQQLQQLQARLRELNPDALSLAQINAELNTLDLLINRQIERASAKNAVDRATTELAAARQAYDQRATPVKTWAEISALNGRINTLQSAWNTLNEHLSKQMELATCDKPKTVDAEGRHKCVQCGLSIANPEALSPEALQQSKTNLERMGQEIDADRLAHKTYLDNWVQCDREAQSLASAVKHWEAALNTATADLSGYVEEDATQAERRKSTLARILGSLPEIQNNIASLNRDMTRLMQERTGYKLAQANLAQKDRYTDELERQWVDTMAGHKAEQSTRRAQFNELTRLHTMIGSFEKQINEHTTAKGKLEQAMSVPMPGDVAVLSHQLGGSLKAVQAELQARRDARSSAWGQLVQATETADKAVQEHLSLQQRVKADEEKRKLIEDLYVLRDTLKPEGLPMSVVRYHFNFLATLTQEALNRLDANFSIEIDPETPLSFRFNRLDEPEHPPLPMTKLSGGQRVRLCTAFLIAVQQRLVSEVGLLVLDEPSTHIDQTGVESLAELLRTLGYQLRNSETQIFVSDHHPSLKNCFTKVLELS